ncbi:hypothetical protein GPLA_3395 [Paraglaciecola polaris LMG 21857]|uniref:Uncharacterized protein n=1 Tax=Paraglaciecola polaris LMG 21857 TaxID=1129793 RepID=K6YNM9_9ALTE|nr:hypothetical protein GPLA_3395 [Paraglaciecola polaris LMG 21857]
MKLGLVNKTPLWAKKGSRPRAVKQQFEYAYLFGRSVQQLGRQKPC